MTCILCDSWAHCPVNPQSLHPRKRDNIIDRDVEVALLTGYVWGTLEGDINKLCIDHQEMVTNLTAVLKTK